MNHSKNNSKARKIDAMDREARHAYLASGRVTVDYVDLAVEAGNGSKKLQRFYVAKIRGVVVGNSGEYTHETPEAAREYGQRILKQWRSSAHQPGGGS